MKKQGLHQVLPEHEWAFHRVPPDELEACADWELSRHRGLKVLYAEREYSLEPAWLAMSASLRKELADRLVDDCRFQELAITDAVWQAAMNQDTDWPYQIRLLSVDFSAPEGELIRRFRAWLDSHPRRKEWLRKPPLHRFLRNRPPSNRPPWRTWLLNIAIYRANRAGLKRRESIRVLTPLLKAWGITEKTTEGKISSSHWSRSLREAKKLALPP